MAKEKAHCLQAFDWLNHHRPGVTAGFTGTDYRVIRAVAHLWELYAVADQPEAVLRAVAAVATQIQGKYLDCVFELIPRSLDWGDRAPLEQRVRAIMARPA